MRNDTCIPDGWRVASLSELSGCITSGATPEAGNPRYYTPTAGHLFAKIEDLTKAVGHELYDCGLQITDAALRETAAKLYPVGTILVSMYGTIGLVKMCGRPLSANQALCALLPPFDCDPGFLLHHLDFIRSEWTKFSGQTTQPNINGSIVRGHQVLLPPMEEQGAISGVLDTIDTTIRQTEVIIEKLKQVKQGLLHDLLTRGIDANGELRPPQSEAPHLYKASPLGWIPDSWEVRRIGDIGETVTGSTPPSSDPYAWGFHRPFVTPVEVVEGPGISCAERNISERGAGYVRMLPAGSTLVVCIGSTIGKVGFALVELCTNQQINAVIPGEMVVPEYLPLATQKGIAQLRAMAGLQAVPIVNKSAFDSMLIPVPPRWEQEIICERLSALAARSHREEQLVAKLQQTKSGLMDDLLTGRVRVTSLLAQPTGT